jgi:hypothetical protein
MSPVSDEVHERPLEKAGGWRAQAGKVLAKSKGSKQALLGSGGTNQELTWGHGKPAITPSSIYRGFQ